MASAAPTELGSRNPTEDAILEAAREALREEPYDRVTIDGIARRAFVSRTTVYFYFENKRAVVDRLIQRAFADMYDAAAPYLEGDGDPRAELHAALAGVVAVVDRDASILRLALWLYGREDHLPAEWAPYIQKLVVAGAKRIARDQARGLAPDDIPARTSALALSAMVERHVGMEIVRSGRDGHESIRVLSELWWRAVYSKPAD
jgi:TetR/AcrR family transcriptional regulator, ethionamide resistance regulator